MNNQIPHTVSQIPAAIFGSALLLLALISMNGCGRQRGPQSNRIHVVAGILPYADITRQIGGEHVEVESLIPSGQNPHTFELDPGRVMNVSDADLLIFNGAGLEMWADKVAERHSGSVRTLWADRVIHDSLIEMDAHNHDGHHHSGGFNPHFWLDPVLMKSVSAAIRDALIAVDPKHHEYYAARCSAFIARLDSLDAGIRDGIDTWRTKSFVTTHSAWSYFCKRYRLHEAAALEGSPGKEISAKQMAAMAEFMKSEGLEVIFTQHMFPDAIAHALSRETGAKIAALDPYGNNHTSMHYIELMKYNFDTMKTVMR